MTCIHSHKQFTSGRDSQLGARKGVKSGADISMMSASRMCKTTLNYFFSLKLLIQIMI